MNFKVIRFCTSWSSGLHTEQTTGSYSEQAATNICRQIPAKRSLGLGLVTWLECDPRKARWKEKKQFAKLSSDLHPHCGIACAERSVGRLPIVHSKLIRNPSTSRKVLQSTPCPSAPKCAHNLLPPAQIARTLAQLWERFVRRSNREGHCEASVLCEPKFHSYIFFSLSILLYQQFTLKCFVQAVSRVYPRGWLTPVSFTREDSVWL